MTDNQQQDEFEYNDGLGDLLREKEKREFSWIKTTIVLFLLIGVCAFTIKIFYNASQSLLAKKSGTQQITQADLKAQIQKEQMQIQETEIDKDEAPIASQENDVSVQPADKLIIQAVQPKTIQATPITPKIQTVENASYKVIAGTFLHLNNAKRLNKKLKQNGVDSFVWQQIRSEKLLYLVQTGAYHTLDQANSYVVRLKAKGFQSYVYNKK
jgi:cell division septation protein DedD